MTKLLLAIAATLLLAACDPLQAAAPVKRPANQKLPDISKMSDEELQSLPEDVSKKLPAKAVFDRLGRGVMAPLANFQTTDALSRLSYFDPIPEQQVRNAIKKFQRDISQPQTGELTFFQFQQLQSRAKVVSENEIHLTSGGWDKLIVSKFQNSYVSTEGTWTIEEEKIAYPVNHSKIVCERSKGTCEVDQVDIELSSLDGPRQDTYVLHQGAQTYHVISWTASEVISQAEGECRTTIMTINVSNNEVFQVTRNNGGECDLGVAKFAQLDRPRIARLLPTGKTIFDFWQERSKATLRYRNSEVAQRLERLGQAIRAAENTREKAAAK